MANPEKAAAVEELKELFNSSTAAVLTEYRGLSVTQLQKLRSSVRENANYAVVKNTLTEIAAKDLGIEAFQGKMVGPSAIAFVHGDAVDVAKALRDFAKENPQLIVKGGYMDGETLDETEMKKLADLESREVLLGKLAGAFIGAQSKAASTFQAPISQIARAADALRAKQEEAA